MDDKILSICHVLNLSCLHSMWVFLVQKKKKKKEEEARLNNAWTWPTFLMNYFIHHWIVNILWKSFGKFKFSPTISTQGAVHYTSSVWLVWYQKNTNIKKKKKKKKKNPKPHQNHQKTQILNK